MADTKKKILIITFTVPYPAEDGGKIYIYSTVDYLRHFYDITLLVKAYSSKELENIEQLKAVWPEVALHVVACITRPVVAIRPSFYRKCINKIRATKNYLLSLRHKPQPETSGPEVKDRPLQENEFTLLDEDFITRLHEIISNNSFDIVQVEYTPYLSLINMLPDEAVKIFVEIESRHLLLNDFRVLSAKPGYYLDYYIENTRQLEYSYMARYDYIFTLSKDDQARISKALPGKQVLLSPYSVLDQHLRWKEEIADFNVDKLVFLGSENHFPNVDAVEWFLTSVYPQIENQTNIPIYITGKWSEEFKAPFAENPNIIFTGFVEKIETVLRNSIMIAPIRLGGGGLRAKLIQAMAFGMPIIATPLASDGSGAEDGRHILVAASVDEFTKAVIQLKSDHELCMKLANNARQLVTEKYTSAVTGTLRRKLYDTICQQRSEVK